MSTDKEDNDEVAEAVDNPAEGIDYKAQRAQDDRKTDYKAREAKKAADKAKEDSVNVDEAGDDFGKKRKDARK